MKSLFRPAIMVASLVFLVACVSQQTRPGVNLRSANGLAYDLTGDGPVVVLIHGTNLDRRMWDAEAGWLQEHTRVLRYDLRGQGGSDFPTNPYSNHGDLLEFMDELGFDAVTLVGISAGAQVALDVALAAPNLVQRVVMVSPSLSGYVPTEMPAFFTELANALRAGNFDEANEVLLASPIMSVPPEYADRVRMMVEDNGRLWTIPYSLIEQSPQPSLERLEEIEMPVLILVGNNDLDAIQRQGALLQRRIVGARLITVAGGGHLLNLTSPESFRDSLSRFLGIPGN